MNALKAETEMVKAVVDKQIIIFGEAPDFDDSTYTFKLIDFQNGTQEFYDLETDPSEQTDPYRVRP